MSEHGECEKNYRALLTVHHQAEERIRTLEAEVARLRESEQRALQESRAAMEECAAAQDRVRELEAFAARAQESEG